MSPKPKIVTRTNGPLGFIADPVPSDVPGLKHPDGLPYSSPRIYALCRCGSSKNKPFCDGSHIAAGFKSQKDPTGHPDRLQEFPRDSASVRFNRSICAGAGLCVKTLPSVFIEGERDWIRPKNAASVEELRATIAQCPSGALSLVDEAGSVIATDGDRPARVTVTPNGPYRIEGDIELIGDQFAQGASTEHYTLCRCGFSKSKPFCDYSHAELGWDDGSGK